MELPSPLPIAATAVATDDNSAKARRVLTYGLFGLLALFSYLNQLIYRYQVPPGGDAINHNAIVTQILTGRWAEALHYHFLWHLLIAGVSLLTHARPITVMAWLGPLLLVSGGVTLFYFNKKYFGWVAGITALILFGFFSRQPLQTLYDGGFPDVLAGATVLPLVLMAVEYLSGSAKKAWPLALLVVSLLGLLYTHHLTFLLTLGLLAIYAIIRLLLSLSAQGRPWWQILPIGIGVYFVFVLAAGLFLHFSQTSAAGLANLFAQVNWHWPFVHLIGQVADPNQIFDITAYPNALGEALVYLGLGGVAVAIGYFLRKSDSPRGRVSLLLLVWFIVLAIGSRNPHLGFPSRLMRDLAIPLCLLAGLFLQWLADFCRTRGIPKALLVIAIVFSFASGWPTLLARVSEAVTPNPLVYQLAADNQAATTIATTVPANSNIVVFRGGLYLPLFVDNQIIASNISDDQKLKITNPAEVPLVFPAAQYIYFQYRLDQPAGSDNNASNLKSYLASPLMKAVIHESQPEEEVYLFKVLKRAKTIKP